MQFVAVSLTLTLVAAVVFVCTIFPIWAMVHCARSTLSPNEKTVWIIVLVVTWSLGAIIYGFVTKERGPFKVVAWLSVVVAVCFAAALIWAVSWALTTLPRTNAKQNAQLVFHVGKTDKSELTAAQLAELQSMLNAFAADSRDGSVFNLRRLADVGSLQNYLMALIADKRLTSQEFLDLHDYYVAYKTGRLDSKTLNNWVRKAS